ncbi:MAG: pyruvate formate lyase family protein [Lentisphaeria bacterium]
MRYTALKTELKNYYRAHSFQAIGAKLPYNPLRNIMDDYFAAHSNLNAMEQKAAQYELIAEHCSPVIFQHSPFFSELGLKISEYDGHTSLSSGGYVYCRNSHLFHDIAPLEAQQYSQCGSLGLHSTFGMYCDPDHHCFPFTKILENGLEKVWQQTMTSPANPFQDAAATGLLAIKRIAEKFSLAAEAQQRPQLARLARRIPWKAAQTFYEGLACLWFLHELGAVMDGIGMSILGHPDRMLYSLYKNDLATGRLNKTEAYELICQFLLQTDCKLDMDIPSDEQFNYGEQGDTLILGGCDADGNEICNDLTFLFLQAHRELKLIYPKIHCRISRQSSQSFLESASENFLEGRNTLAFLNDDSIIPAQLKAGKSLIDARRYVAGGCWEIILEGSEHSEGANCYYNLAKLVDLSIHDSREFESATGEYFAKIDGADDFETVYATVLNNAIRSIQRMAQMIARNGKVWPQVNPSPLFSACLDGCLESKLDYTAGGAKYSPHGLPLGGLAILIDSLMAIKKLCFDKQVCTLDELLTAVRNNWDNCEVLRQAALGMEHFGDGKGNAAALTRRFLRDIAKAIKGLKNEQGGTFQLGIYIYREIISWAKMTRATPDGRRKGDFLSQGLNVSRRHNSDGVTSILNDAAKLDLSDYPANSVITLSLARQGLNPKLVSAFLRSFTASGIGMLQLNILDRAELLDACLHPENHHDLIVRLYGYSARFITLNAEQQQEFLSRSIY